MSPVFKYRLLSPLLKLLLAASLLWMMSPRLPALMHMHEVVIVKSSDNVFFEKSAETLIDHADESLSFRVILPDQLDTELAADQDSRLFVAFGAPALDALRQFDANASVISAYLTLEQYRDLAIDDQLAILLDQPPDRYLAFSKLLLDPETIGVILEDELESDATLAASMQEHGLTLNRYRLDADNKLMPVLRDLFRENDALLMLPRNSIYNPDTLKAVLLTSYRNRKPAISYSPAHVRAGALASIYSSPVDIGRHLAQIVNQRLEHPASLAPGYEYARFYSIATNPSVAQALELDLLDESEIRSGLDRVKP